MCIRDRLRAVMGQWQWPGLGGQGLSCGICGVLSPCCRNRSNLQIGWRVHELRFGWACLSPVSYTHLDVYKRQAGKGYALRWPSSTSIMAGPPCQRPGSGKKDSHPYRPCFDLLSCPGYRKTGQNQTYLKGLFNYFTTGLEKKSIENIINKIYKSNSLLRPCLLYTSRCV